MEVTVRNVADSTVAINMIASIYEQQVAHWLGLSYEGWANKLRIKAPYFRNSKCLVQPGYGGRFYVALNISDFASGRPVGCKPGVWKGDYASAFKFREKIICEIEGLSDIEWIYGDNFVTGVFPEILV